LARAARVLKARANGGFPGKRRQVPAAQTRLHRAAMGGMVRLKNPAANIRIKGDDPE
jgi:hypothetical protein